MLNKSNESNDNSFEITIREEADAHIICIGGKIDANNAKEFEQKMQELVKQENSRIILDVENLYYISSAGLRGLIRLQSSLKEKMILINVSNEVFEVFEITGFNEIMIIHKKPRKITIDQDQFIARGTFGTIYRIDDDTVVKVFSKEFTMQKLALERARASKVFLAGVPTVVTYDVVEVDGQLGIILELARGAILAERISKEPENFDQLTLGYARFLKEIHSKSMSKGDIPDVKDAYHGFVDAAKYLDDKQKEMLHGLLDAVPDALTVLHGDYHTNNVLFQDGEMIAIDLDDVSLGNPLFDLAGMYSSHILIGQYNPDLVRAGLGIDYETCKKVWERFIQDYFDNDTPKEREEKLDVIRRFGQVKVALVYVFAAGFEQIVGWKPFEDAAKVLFEQDSYSKLINDVKIFRG